MEILLGMGGSPDSRLALRETVSSIATADDRLTVAILRDAHSDTTVDELETLIETTAAEAGMSVEIEVIDGDPGPALTDLAESAGYDQVVIGGGKRSPMGKISLGEITEFVVLNADTTVTLVR